MADSRWKKIEQIFTGASELSGAARRAYLRSKCQGDEALFAEVSSLLHEIDMPSPKLEVSVFETGLKIIDVNEIDGRIGRNIGQFRIDRLIGSGGMGAVYAGEDTRNKQPVAIKLANQLFALDPERIRRFRKEATAAARVSHPNVAKLYELCEFGDEHLIVMEFVEGINLREFMVEGVSPVNALDVAIQIAEALVAAHSVGVVHRDIKPENIIVQADGSIKVLDFGLAKLVDPIGQGALHIPGGDDTKLTVDMSTELGSLMGTPAYMSPEQIRGIEVDTQTDIWSLGVLLYEMLSGHLPFRGATKIDLIANILISQPTPIEEYKPEYSNGLNSVLLTVLSKEKSERYRRADELLVDLTRIKKVIAPEADLFLTTGSSESQDAKQTKALDFYTTDMDHRTIELETLDTDVKDSKLDLRWSSHYTKKSSVFAVLILGVAALSMLFMFQLTRSYRSEPRRTFSDDAIAGFSIASNPNGNWTYGFSPPNDISLFSSFKTTDHDRNFQVSGMPVDSWQNPDSPHPLIMHNASNSEITVERKVILSPNLLDLHPGKEGQRSVLRWTAPANAMYRFTGQFQGIDLDGATTDAVVVQNSELVLFNEYVKGFGVPKAFDLSRVLAAGDTIDFSVGYGGNGYNSDSTGLGVTVTRIPLSDSPQGGPTSYWPADGNADDLVGGNHGELVSGATYNVGVSGQAFSFDGLDDRVTIPNSPNLNVGTGDFSMSFFALFNSLANNKTGLVHKDNYSGQGSYNGWLFNICDLCDGIGGIGIETRNLAQASDKDARYPSSNFQVGVWYNIAVVRQSNVLYLYVDGVLRSKVRESIPTDLSNTSNLEFGSLSSGSRQNFSGSLDEIFFFNRALSADEVRTLFLTNSPPN